MSPRPTPEPPARTKRARRGGGVPLARALSKLALASRAEARRLIVDGRVRVDGRVVRDPARPVVPERIALAIDDVPAAALAPRILVFHKPRGTITTRRDPEGRPTVFDVLGDAGRGMIAVGRLDRASTGLLVLTTDTRLAHALTDPERRIARQYIVTVRGRVVPDTAARLCEGLEVADAGGRPERLQASAVTIRKASERETHLIVELRQGRNREIRRLFDAAGHEVTRLHRVSFGPFTLGALAPGAWRKATPSEQLAAERLQPRFGRLPGRTE